MIKRRGLLVLFYGFCLAIKNSHSYAILSAENEDSEEDLSSVANEKLTDLQRTLLISSRGFLYSIKEILEDFEEDQDDFLEDFIANLEHSLKEPLVRLEDLKKLAKNHFSDSDHCFKNEYLIAEYFNETANRVTTCFDDAAAAVTKRIFGIVDEFGVNKTAEVIDLLRDDLDQCADDDDSCFEIVISDIDEWKENYPLQLIEAMYEVTVYESGGGLLVEGCLEVEKEEMEKRVKEVMDDIRLCVKKIIK